MSFAALVLLITAASPTQHDVEFVGFSHNEGVAAWRIRVEGEADINSRHPNMKTSRRYLYRYSLIRVVATATDEEVGTYRESDLERGIPGQEAMQPVRGRKALKAVPAYRRALSQKRWFRYSQEQRFSAKPFNPARKIITVTPNSAARLTIRDHSVRIHAAENKLALTVSAFLVNGAQIEIGHYQSYRSRKQTTATVRIFRSCSGYHAAVLIRYSSPRAQKLPPTTDYAVHRFEYSPLIGGDEYAAAHSGVQQVIFAFQNPGIVAAFGPGGIGKVNY